MSKSTIASLVRNAARDEAAFVETTQQVLDEEDADRIAEYFDKLNIPRSVGSDSYLSDIPSIRVTPDKLGSWAAEAEISDGIQKFLDRHARKLKWHATHPSLEGAENVMLLTRCGMIVTNLRISRLEALLKRDDSLPAVAWSQARTMMNRSFLTFKNLLEILSDEWIDALQSTSTRKDVGDKLGNFYEYVDTQIRHLEEARERIEERRLDLTVIPVSSDPPVKPPIYFNGDIIPKGPWKQLWAQVDSKAHHFREMAG
jgi:hypothetical protein